jgi:hypothetical protein
MRAHDPDLGSTRSSAMSFARSFEPLTMLLNESQCFAFRTARGDGRNGNPITPQREPIMSRAMTPLKNNSARRRVMHLLPRRGRR